MKLFTPYLFGSRLIHKVARNNEKEYVVLGVNIIFKKIKIKKIINS